MDLRSFQLGDKARVGIAGIAGIADESGALRYARWLLARLGASVTELDADSFDADMPVLIAGHSASDALRAAHPERQRTPLLIRLWDFQVNMAGTGVQASAVSGVAWVIGLPGKAPMYLTGRIPEKWCGTLGVGAALAWHAERVTLPQLPPPARVFDVSTAEVLRAFADQNFSNHRLIPTSWRRNGRISLDHGGIFPQGFFRCRDGHVAVVGRSGEDWLRILAALGDPAWATEEMRNPFALAHDSAHAEELFEAELQKYTRQELLDLALRSGATFAPIYDKSELSAAHIVRESYFDADGHAGLPFEFFRGA